MTGFDMDASWERSCLYLPDHQCIPTHATYLTHPTYLTYATYLTHSEQELQRELNLARRAGGGRDPARCRTETAATVDRLGEDGGGRLSGVHVVRQVEHLGAELKRRGSPKGDVFQDREVGRREFWPRQAVPADAAERARRRERERRRIEPLVDVARRDAVQTAAGREVRTLPACSEPGLIKQGRRERRAAGQVQDAAELPALDEPVPFERQGDHTAGSEGVRPAETARAVVVVRIVRVGRRRPALAAEVAGAQVLACRPRVGHLRLHVAGEPPIEARLQRVIRRRRERGAGVQRRERRVDAHIGDDADGRGTAGRAVDERSVRQRPRRDRVDVTLLEQIDAARPDVPNRRERRLEHFPLKVEVPLLLIGGIPRLVVDALALRGKRRSHRGERRREAWRHYRQILAADDVWRVEVVRGAVDAGRDHVVEDAVPGANRRPVIGERIVNDAEPRVEVLERGVLHEYRIDRREGRRAWGIYERNPRRDGGVRGGGISQSEVQRQRRRRFPLVLHVRREVPLAEFAVRVVLSGQGAHHGSGLVLQERLQASERPHAAPLKWGIDVGGLSFDRAAHLDAVRPGVEVQIVGRGVLALKNVERIQLVRADHADAAARIDGAVHAVRKELQRGIRAGVVGQLTCPHEAEPHLIDDARGNHAPGFGRQVLIVRAIRGGPERQIRSAERLEQIRGIGDVARKDRIARRQRVIEAPQGIILVPRRAVDFVELSDTAAQERRRQRIQIERRFDGRVDADVCEPAADRDQAAAGVAVG